VVARPATTAAKAKTLAREKVAVIPRVLAHRKKKRQTPSNLELSYKGGQANQLLATSLL
jgi:hypothetical protein